jgi:hypothetical protein
MGAPLQPTRTMTESALDPPVSLPHADGSERPASAARLPTRLAPGQPAGRLRIAVLGTTLVCVLLATLLGCGTVTPRAAPDLTADSGCTGLADALDSAAAEAGTVDAGTVRVPGARWLRADRFAASFAGESLTRDAVQTWLERLRDADARARAIEIANTPDSALTAVFAGGDPRVVRLERERLAVAVERCGRLEARSIAASPVALEAMHATLRVPDDYVDAARTIGLYPITARFFAAGVRREEASMTDAYRRHGADIGKDTVAYAPAVAAEPWARADAPARDALGVPRLDAARAATLLAAFAPVYAVAGRGPDDRIGALGLDPNDRPVVDVDRPVVYGRVAFTRWAGAVKIQLVYTAWFARRAPAGPFDPLAGHLDGVVVRITLDDNGAPAMVDTIHACGCWHQFVPVGDWRVRPAPVQGDEWAFVPTRLREIAPGRRLRVRLEARTHAVEGMDTVAADAAADVRYALDADDVLRTLPRPAGGTRSVYDPRGRVPGTERPERWLFWPMGIADAGSMRQWGRHATAFVGRRHFDDADLFERRFERAATGRAGGQPEGRAD